MKVIKVGAIWCSGCLVMKPRWREVEQEKAWLCTEMYDYDESPAVIEKYHVDESLPVAIFVDKQGVELARYVGEVEKDELLRAIEKYKDQ